MMSVVVKFILWCDVFKTTLKLSLSVNDSFTQCLSTGRDKICLKKKLCVLEFREDSFLLFSSKYQAMDFRSDSDVLYVTKYIKGKKTPYLCIFCKFLQDVNPGSKI